MAQIRKSASVVDVPPPTSSANNGLEVPRTRQLFVNRPIRLDRIEWIGFDLDYTLALYKIPQYDAMTFDLLIDALIKLGYPESLRTLKYDPNFIIKGVCLDLQRGNVLKLGKFANIVECYHGRQKLTKAQISSQYPSMRVPHDMIGAKGGAELMNTTYDVPKASVFADVIDHLKSQGHTPDKGTDDGKAGPLSYNVLWNDILKVAQSIHAGSLKKNTLDNLEAYVHGGPELALTLDKLRRAGKKLFLLTNSPWFYTNGIMTWMLQTKSQSYATWTDYFDVVIADASKPTFFLGSEEFREISRETGHLGSGQVTCLQRGKIYSGGNHRAFEEMTQIKAGDTVLYVGDHIFSDVMISKKRHAWRTLLIIPELASELEINDMTSSSYKTVTDLAVMQSAIQASLDVTIVSPSATEFLEMREKVQGLKKQIRTEIKLIDNEFNPHFGSMFRSGLHQSFFAMQVGRYADLYAPSVLSFLHYSLLRSFTAPFLTLPHEAMDDITIV